MAKPTSEDSTTTSAPSSLSSRILTAQAISTPLPAVRVTRETIKSLRVSREKIQKAASSLKKLGFSIEPEGGVSITISGTKENFEGVFKIQLEEKKEPMRGAQVNDSQPLCYYVPHGTLKIPDDLGGLV